MEFTIYYHCEGAAEAAHDKHFRFKVTTMIIVILKVSK